MQLTEGQRTGKTTRRRSLLECVVDSNNRSAEHHDLSLSYGTPIKRAPARRIPIEPTAHDPKMSHIRYGVRRLSKRTACAGSVPTKLKGLHVDNQPFALARTQRERAAHVHGVFWRLSEPPGRETLPVVIASRNLERQR